MLSLLYLCCSPPHLPAVKMAAKLSSSPTCPQHLTGGGAQNRADPPFENSAYTECTSCGCSSSTARVQEQHEEGLAFTAAVVNPAGRACKSPLRTRSHAVPKSAPSPGHGGSAAACWGYFCSKHSPTHPSFHFLQLLQVRGCPKYHPLGMQSLRPDPGGDAKAHLKPCEVSCSLSKTPLGSNRPDLFFLIPGKTSLTPGLTQPVLPPLPKRGKTLPN